MSLSNVSSSDNFDTSLYRRMVCKSESKVMVIGGLSALSVGCLPYLATGKIKSLAPFAPRLGLGIGYLLGASALIGVEILRVPNEVSSEASAKQLVRKEVVRQVALAGLIGAFVKGTWAGACAFAACSVLRSATGYSSPVLRGVAGAVAVSEGVSGFQRGIEVIVSSED